MSTSQQALVTLAGAARRLKELREAERLEESFYEFVKAAWHVFDPAEFVDNWHLSDICEHMEAVARGHIPRLLLNVPPRTGKTALVSVCFCAWVWAQRTRAPLMGPHVSFFYASYAEQLSLEHSLKCRRLIESRWYQRLWGGRFKLASDRNTKGHFENDKGGYRMASSVDARATGYGADILCLPAGEKVLTSLGWMPIDDIVRNNSNVTVAGYDHDHKRLIWQEILAYERNPGRPILEIKFDTGSFRCTPDHPVFVEGRGYVRADTAEVGQILWAVPGMREKITRPQSVEQSLQGMSEQGSHRCEHDFPASDGAACPSHQLRQERYGDRQSDLGVPGLSWSDAWPAGRAESLAKAVIRSVENVGYADVTFNLNVGPCHNYFVGGALVHNCADDPHLVKEAESDLVRESVVRWWSETMPSRLNNRRTGAMIVVMQRVHEGDVAGDILSKDGRERNDGRPPNYVHFCAPMAYVPCQHVNAWVGDKIETLIGEDAEEVADDDIFWVDRRAEDGELLWPARFPASEVIKLERELGPYAFAGQYQQEPAPRGGGIIRTEWWKPYDDEAAKEHGAEPGRYPDFEYILASLDTAYTEKEENDPSALSVWGIFRDKAGNPKIMLMFCWQDRLMFHELVSRVGADCQRFKVDRLIIEDKAAGHSVSQELARLFGSFDFGIELVNPRTGFIKSPDKVARLQTVVHLFAEGLVYAPDKVWSDEMIKQCSLVPRAIHDDLADTCSMALIYLRRAGWAVKKEERALEVEDETRYRPQARALYGGI